MEIFFEHFYDRVYGYVASLLRDRDLAEDITHDTFLRLHRSMDRLDPTRDPAPWVFTIVSNLVRDHWRSPGHRQRRQQVEVEEIERLPDPGGADQYEKMEKAEAARIVRSAMTGLAPEDREIILLRTFQNLDTDQLTAILGISADAVRQRHSRAVKRLGSEYRRLMDTAGA